MLTDFENHEQQTSYEDSLIFKTFLFQFMNSYLVGGSCLSVSLAGSLAALSPHLVVALFSLTLSVALHNALPATQLSVSALHSLCVSGPFLYRVCEAECGVWASQFGFHNLVRG